MLPAFLDEVHIRNLQVTKGASVDVTIQRHPTDVGGNVLRKDAGVEVVVIK